MLGTCRDIVRIVLPLIGLICFASHSSAVDEDRLAVVVVPAGWESSVNVWQEYRRNQGYSVEIITARSTADETRSALRSAVRSKPNSNVFILIGADAVPINQLHDLEQGEPYVPTFYLPSEAIVRFGGEPEIATDYPYGDLDEDGVYECAVGRVPANNPKQLATLLNRSIRYEQESIRGSWQYEMNLTAGVGGFSVLADMAIDGFAKTVLVEALPKEFQLFVAQASPHSPYFPPPSQFRNAVVEQLNRNSLLWVYMGHGSVQELDRIESNEHLYPILTSNDISDLKSSHSSSLAFLLACYSGAFDAPMPCLGEAMLKNEHGPVAVIGATRVSMPYGMGVIAKEMLREAFANHTGTIGEILRNAKQASIDLDPTTVGDSESSLDALMSSMASVLSPSDHSLVKELEEHRWLMNLMGDPTLMLPTSQSLQFECALDSASRTINVEGDGDIAGELVVQVLCDRGNLPAEAMRLISLENKNRKEDPSIRERDSLQRFNAANNLVVSQINKAVGKGRFNAKLDLPDDCNGKFLVRCTLCSRKQSAVGVTSIVVSR